MSCLYIPKRICPTFLPVRLIGFLLCVLSMLSVNGQFITTIAGNGNSRNFGDGGPATCAEINNATGICADTAGNVYFTSGNAIRKVDAHTGIISTIAGSDAFGYSGDGGPAKQAQMMFPFNICMDSHNNLFITEYSGHRIRRIDGNTGIITTIAGNGRPGFSGDGGPAARAILNTPHGIAVDGNGNLYVADDFNSRIRKIDAATGTITSIAGNGSAEYSGDGGSAEKAGISFPVSVCVDTSGNIYFTEVYAGTSVRVRKINRKGIISTITGKSNSAFTGDGGQATEASLLSPDGLCIDQQGNLYIAQYDDARIRKVDAASGRIVTYAGTGTYGFSGDGAAAVTATLHGPKGLCADGKGRLYVVDSYNQRIRMIYNKATELPPYFPDIHISGDLNDLCSGAPVTFTASVPGNATSGIYRWYINNRPAGTNTSTAVFNTLHSGDTVSCTLTNNSCGVTVSHSNDIVIPAIGAPSVVITASNNPLCTGTEAVFTASATNCGNAPTYNWMVNGTASGIIVDHFTTSGLHDGDVVTCSVIPDPSSACSFQQTIISGPVIMKMLPDQAPYISISPSAINICPGTPVRFYAMASHAGSSPSFLWKVNGDSVGTTDHFSATNLQDNDQVTCLLTEASSNCPITYPISSNTAIIHVYSLPQIQVFPADTAIEQGLSLQLTAAISGPVASWSWSPGTAAGNNLSLSAFTQPLQDNMIYTLNATTAEGCTASASSHIRVWKTLYIPTAFTPDGNGKNDVFRIPPGTALTLQSFDIYNRWGQKLFSTSDSGKGWDGRINGLPAPAGTYIYTVKGAQNKRQISLKGSFVLIR